MEAKPGISFGSGVNQHSHSGEQNQVGRYDSLLL